RGGPRIPVAARRGSIAVLRYVANVHPRSWVGNYVLKDCLGLCILGRRISDRSGEDTSWPSRMLVQGIASSRKCGSPWCCLEYHALLSQLIQIGYFAVVFLQISL